MTLLAPELTSQTDKTRQMQDFHKLLLSLIDKELTCPGSLLIDILPIGVELYNKQGVLVAANKCDAEIFGVSKKEALLGINLFYDISLNEDFSDRIAYEDSITLWRYYDFDNKGRSLSSNKSGKIKLFTRFCKVRNERGNVTGYIIINIDDQTISSGRYSPEARGYVETNGSMRLHAGYNNRNELIELVAHDVDNEVATMLGKSMRDMEDRNILHLGIHMPYIDKIGALNKNNPKFTFYYYALSSRKYLRWSVNYMGNDDYLCRLIDVTDNLMGNSGVKFSETMFRAMFDGSPIATIFTDVNRRVEEVNPAFLKMAGSSTKKDVIGFIFPRNPKNDRFESLHPELDEYDYEEHYVLDKEFYPDARRRNVIARVKRQKFYGPDSALRGYIFFINDITEEASYKKRITIHNDKVKQESDSKTRFIQNMSHDIRTPLNAIVGFSQLLSLPDGSLSEEEKEEYATHVSNNSNMLMMLVEDILNIADVEEGNYRISAAPTRCNELCRNVLKSVEYRVPLNVKLYFTSDVDENETINTDGRRVQQVLVNFLTNACKHTTEGEIRLECKVRESEKQTHFSVIDTGTGVDPAIAENIFERFVTYDGMGGTGLGLNICNTISKRLGGHVSLDRSYTGGAKFDLYLPKVPPAK